MTREEAIKYLIEPVSTSTSDGEEKQKEFEAYKMAIKALEQQKIGKWIYNGYYECSECGKTTYNDTYNYCPNCGADLSL